MTAIGGQNFRVPLVLLALLSPVFVWSWIDPYDRLVWWLEASPAVIAVILLGATAHRFRFTDLVYILIALHAVLLLVGAHYTYSRMPLFNHLSDMLDLGRNHYDRLGHIFQGFVPAMVARELLLRTSPLRPGKWLFALIVLSCAGISAIYEIIEWLSAEIGHDGSDDFLGSQGDIWDAQKDMLLCTLGAMAAQLLLARTHDRQLAMATPS